jgi:hypothetical protein
VISGKCPTVALRWSSDNKKKLGNASFPLLELLDDLISDVSENICRLFNWWPAFSAH